MNLIKPVFAVVSNTDPVVGKLDISGISPVTEIGQVGPKFLTPIIVLIITLAGIWSLIQFILGGFGYITGAGDPKKVQEAQNKLVHSIIGLVIIAVSFILAALIGAIFFDNPLFILSPDIKTQ